MKGFCCLISEVAPSFINEGHPGAQQPSFSTRFVTEDLERKHPAKGDSCAVTVLPCLRPTAAKWAVCCLVLPSGSAYISAISSMRRGGTCPSGEGCARGPWESWNSSQSY